MLIDNTDMIISLSPGPCVREIVSVFIMVIS